MKSRRLRSLLEPAAGRAGGGHPGPDRRRRRRAAAGRRPGRVRDAGRRRSGGGLGAHRLPGVPDQGRPHRRCPRGDQGAVRGDRRLAAHHPGRAAGERPGRGPGGVRARAALPGALRHRRRAGGRTEPRLASDRRRSTGPSPTASTGWTSGSGGSSRRCSTSSRRRRRSCGSRTTPASTSTRRPMPSRWALARPHHRGTGGGGADDDRVEGPGRRVVGAGDDARAGRPAPRVPGAGDRERSATRSWRPRPATGCRSTYIEVRFVNDHCYARVRPVGAPEPKPGKPSKAPPGFVLWVLARLHPELRRRAKAARRALDERLWREDLRRVGAGRPRRDARRRPRPAGRADRAARRRRARRPPPRVPSTTSSSASARTSS